MLRLAFDFIITWRETRTRPNAYLEIFARTSQPFIIVIDYIFSKTAKCFYKLNCLLYE